MFDSERFTRRSVLSSSAGIGIAGFAGCVGDEEDQAGTDGESGNDDAGDDDAGDDDAGDESTSDAETVVMAHAGASTSGGTTTEALRRAVRQHSDEVEITTTESGGDPASIRLHDQGDAEGYPSSNFISMRAANDEVPFDEGPVDEVAHQAWRFGTIQCFWMGVDGSGIESIEDLPGKDVWALDPSWGVRQFTEVVLKNHGIWDEINVVNIDSSDMPGAVEEGRVEAFVGFGTNSVSLTGWMKEVDARSEVHMLEVTDDFIQAIEGVPSAQLLELEPYDWDQEVGDSMVSWGLPYQLWFSDRVDDDIVYELARISHEHHDTVREADSAYPDQSDLDSMTRTYVDDIPVHSGMEQFLKDKDAWDESWPTS